MKHPVGVPQEVYPLIENYGARFLGHVLWDASGGTLGSSLSMKSAQRNYGARFTGALHGALHGVLHGVRQNYGARFAGALHGTLLGARQNYGARFTGHFMERFMGHSKIGPKIAFRLAPKNGTLKLSLGGPRPPFPGTWSQIWDPFCLFRSLLGSPLSPEGDPIRDPSSLNLMLGLPRMH